MLCETVQKKKDKNCDFTQVEYKMKKQQMNKQNKQKQIHRYRQQIVITGGERNGGRAKWVKQFKYVVTAETQTFTGEHAVVFRYQITMLYT